MERYRDVFGNYTLDRELERSRVRLMSSAAHNTMATIVETAQTDMRVGHIQLGS
jgi:hypothetical protein